LPRKLLFQGFPYNAATANPYTPEKGKVSSGLIRRTCGILFGGEGKRRG